MYKKKTLIVLRSAAMVPQYWVLILYYEKNFNQNKSI